MKMNKRYLPVIASLLIIAMASTSFLPVFAQLPSRLVAQPTLTVVTIAEDDELRETGVMFFADNMAHFIAGTPAWTKLESQFKILVSYNGVPVTPTSTYCQFVEKDKRNPLKDRQGTWENLASVPKEVNNFVCKFRWGKPGVGVIDVYYIGLPSGWTIADYIMVVGADLAVGRTTVWGTEIQDICVLGWPVAVPVPPAPGVPLAPIWIITKPSGNTHVIFPDALDGWTSCEDVALYEHDVLHIPIQWT